MAGKPKYEEIVDWIKNQIESGQLRDGEKLDSENNLVIKFEVSRQTVRHALDELVNEGLLEKRRGSGTYVTIPVVKVNGPNTRRIAVMTTYVNDYIFVPIIQSIEAVLSRSGYTMHLMFTGNSVEKERELLQAFLKNRDIDGIIAEPTKSNLPSPNIELYKQIQESGIPILQINSYYKELKAPHVCIDDRQAGEKATQYLIGQGHTKIAGIFKLDDGQGGRRYLGYLDALMENNIKISENRIAWIDTVDLKGDLDNFSKITKRIQDCSACLCYNDEVAVKLLELLRIMEISVPSQMSVIGIDNSQLAKHCVPPLTSINNPTNEIGEKAAESIINLINGINTEMEIEINPDIIIRESVYMKRY
ncbi:MAG: GntR family transcriptional regulator [Suipraeoptans sp.]